jgi:tetratricopeptide (TPR) repeat protein
MQYSCPITVWGSFFRFASRLFAIKKKTNRMDTIDPTPNDYDEKLREMGNYLFTLDQEGDAAHREGDTLRVAEIERQIERMARKADHFTQIDGPHNLLAHLVKGLALRMLKQWEAAAQAFLDVLEENPINGEAWLELTWCLGEQGKWSDARLAAEKGIEVYPDVSAAWGNLGHILIQLGEKEKAFSVLQKAVALDPDDLRNHELLGQLQSAN